MKLFSIDESANISAKTVSCCESDGWLLRSKREQIVNVNAVS
jgi:hypothetical protein